MAGTLDERVSILERTVGAEIRERVKMRKDIGEVKELLEDRSKAQIRSIQALGETQSEHTRALREIRETVGRMAPKVDSLEAQMHGMQLRMGHLDARMGGIETRMGSIETRVERLDTRFDRLDSKFGQLDTKIDAVAERLDGKIDALSVQVDEKFNTIIDLLNKKN